MNWEYRILSTNMNESTVEDRCARINGVGWTGWELVSIEMVTRCTLEYTFKRPILPAPEKVKKGAK